VEDLDSPEPPSVWAAGVSVNVGCVIKSIIVYRFYKLNIFSEIDIEINAIGDRRRSPFTTQKTFRGKTSFYRRRKEPALKSLQSKGLAKSGIRCAGECERSFQLYVVERNRIAPLPTEYVNVRFKRVSETRSF
jgi:hypothetical protein